MSDESCMKCKKEFVEGDTVVGSWFNYGDASGKLEKLSDGSLAFVMEQDKQSCFPVKYAYEVYHLGCGEV